MIFLLLTLFDGCGGRSVRRYDNLSSNPLLRIAAEKAGAVCLKTSADEEISDNDIYTSDDPMIKGGRLNTDNLTMTNILAKNAYFFPIFHKYGHNLSKESVPS